MGINANTKSDIKKSIDDQILTLVKFLGQT